MLGEPGASLLIVNFEAGDLLQLQGIAKIDWSAEAARLVEGAERLWYFEVVRGWRRHAASSLRWSFVDYSPITLKTGSWDRSQSRQSKLLGEDDVLEDSTSFRQSA